MKSLLMKALVVAGLVIVGGVALIGLSRIPVVGTYAGKLKARLLG